MTVKDIKAEALSLSCKDRADLAHALLLSLDDSADDDAESLWLDEVEKRCREYDEGKVRARPAEQVLRRARASIRRVRASTR